jgi:uncharacterized membrane protein HdeD (DUF308 family)
MKNIRYLAAILLIIAGVLHIVLYFKTPHDPGIMGVLAFGVIYAAIGLLLLMPNRYAVYLGLIFPIIGIISALVMIGIHNLGYTMILLLLIDIVVIICCGYLLINRSKAIS